MPNTTEMYEFTQDQYKKIRLYETLTAIGSIAALYGGVETGKNWCFVVCGSFAVSSIAWDIGRRECRNNLEATSDSA